MEKRGIRTGRGDLNREIEVTNQKLRQLKARISKLQNWLKEEQENTEPPTLAAYIQGILSRKAQAGKPGYSQSLYNLKDAGSLTINALSAADGVIITVNPQLLAMMGLQDFLKTVGKIRSRINPVLQVEGILLTMCDARTNLCKVITEQVSETFQGQIRIFGSRIPSTVKVGESVYYSKPLLEYAPESGACAAYQNLAKEVIADEG